MLAPVERHGNRVLDQDVGVLEGVHGKRGHNLLARAARLEAFLGDVDGQGVALDGDLVVELERLRVGAPPLRERPPVRT